MKTNRLDAWLNGLPMGRKFSTLIAALLLPLAAMAGTVVAGLVRNALDTDRMEAGIEYSLATRQLLEPLMLHRGLGGRYAAGERGLAPKLDAAAAQAGTALAALEATDERIGGRLRTGTRVHELRGGWDALAVAARELDAPTSFARHVQLIDSLLALELDAADAAGIALDPQVETSYLSDLITRAALPAIDAVAALRGKAAAALADGALSAEEKAALAALEARAAVTAAATEEVLKHLAASPVQDAGAIVDNGRQFVAAAQRLDELVTSRALAAGATLPRAEEIMDVGTAAVTAGFAYYDAGQRHLVEDYAARERADWLRLAAAVLAALAMAGLAVLLGRRMRALVLGHLASARDALRRVAAGDYDTPLHADARDEIGQLVTGLATMQHDLKARLTAEAAEREQRAAAEARTAAENGRIRTALDKVSSPVMLADADGRIIYANEAVQALFRERATDVRSRLPQFDPERIVGSNFDAYHVRPEHQRRVLAGLTGTHQGEFRIGNATLRVAATPVVDRGGERIGSVVEWRDRTAEVGAEEEIRGVVQAALEGDLSQRVPEAGKSGFFAALAGGLNELVGNMAGIVGQIQQAAGSVERSATEVSAGSVDLSSRTEQQAASLEETASSMEQMASTVKANADNAAAAEKLASAAFGEADRGRSISQSVAQSMTQIAGASRRIADILGVIDDIAFQTNLLALNAAVEAARAGESGRGFAVVAAEVRTLATRCGEAAREIKSLIQDSTRAVDLGTQQVQESSDAIERIVLAVRRMSETATEIAGASREQSAGIDQVNQTVTQMDQVTQQNASLVMQTSAAAESLAQQARQLAEHVARYRTETRPEAQPQPGRLSRAA